MANLLQRILGPREHTAAGMALLESVCVLLTIGTLVVPFFGLLDLLLVKTELAAVSHRLTAANPMKSFRLYSGELSWFTRPVNGGDERNTSGNSDRRVSRETAAYHQQLDRMADAAEQKARRILGTLCTAADCTERYRVEVRVLIPYLVYDTADVIRLVCFQRVAAGSGCPGGLASDVAEHQNPSGGPHRFLRIRGALLPASDAFLTFFREKIGVPESPGRGLQTPSLRYAAVPGGMHAVRHAQKYGWQDFQRQSGYVPEDGRQQHPAYLRHVLFVGIRVYVDVQDSPGGTMLALKRRLHGAGESEVPATVVFADAISVPRQEF